MKVASLAVCLTAMFSLLGCAGGETDAPTLHSVTGKVTKDGKGIPNVQVLFSPAAGGGRGATANTSEDGSYTLVSPNAGPGAPAGQYKVVLTASPSADAASMQSAYSGGGDPAAAKPADASDTSIPKEYSSAETTPKTAEVKAEDNVINIEL